MSGFQSASCSLAVSGILALLCGCGDDANFLDYGGLRFVSRNGKVTELSGSWLYRKPLPLPCIRLKGKLNCVLALEEVTEEELIKLGVGGRQTGPDRTVYEFEQGVIRFHQGKPDSFSVNGLRAPGTVSIAPKKEGPFVSLPAPEREINKLFGKPNSISQGRRPFN